jgi:SAM-dependent methyltransferase
MARQAEIISTVAKAAGFSAAKALDIGCGTGWLANELVPFGTVVGIDLSPQAIADGAKRFPALDLRRGDFITMELQGPFDLILSSDSLVGVHDRVRCIQRIAELQSSGGVLILMTQNPFVWSRRSTLHPLDPSVPNGRVEEWPSRRDIRQMLASFYIIEDLYTIVPGGDRGLLFWVENRYVNGVAGRIVGRDRWSKWQERIGLGRELVIVAHRK